MPPWPSLLLVSYLKTGLRSPVTGSTSPSRSSDATTERRCSNPLSVVVGPGLGRGAAPGLVLGVVPDGRFALRGADCGPRAGAIAAPAPPALDESFAADESGDASASCERSSSLL